MKLEHNKEIEIAGNFLQSRGVKEFKDLYDFYFRSLCFFAYSYVKNQAEAEDIVQGAFIKLWQGNCDDILPDKLGGYLYASVRNGSLNAQRKKRNQERYESEAFGEVFQDWQEDESLNIVKSEVYREIIGCIEKLPPRMQEVFKLSYIMGMRDEDISQRLSISINSIKTQKRRAKDILKEDLQYIRMLITILSI